MCTFRSLTFCKIHGNSFGAVGIKICILTQIRCSFQQPLVSPSYFISIALQKICVNFTFAVSNILRIVKLALPCHISNLGHTGPAAGKKWQHSWPISKIQGKHPIQLSNLYEDG